MPLISNIGAPGAIVILKYRRRFLSRERSYLMTMLEHLEVLSRNFNKMLAEE